MSALKLENLLTQNRSNLALLAGNGINCSDAKGNDNSRDKLLITLAQRHLDPSHEKVPLGISKTEFYDVLELSGTGSDGKLKLQRQFCDLMSTW